eukprot:jgi/Tetstr1/428540/TSEL_018534.t1
MCPVASAARGRSWSAPMGHRYTLCQGRFRSLDTQLAGANGPLQHNAFPALRAASTANSANPSSGLDKSAPLLARSCK